MDPQNGPASPWPDRSGWLQIGFLALLLCWNLGRIELSVTDECRSGVIVRDMVEGGHWLLPRTPDGYLCGKPPAYYATSALFVEAFGRSEAALRALSVVAALGALAATAWLAGLYGSTRASWVAAAAIASNLVF